MSGVAHPAESPALEEAKRALGRELRAADDLDANPVLRAYADYDRAFGRRRPASSNNARAAEPTRQSGPAPWPSRLRAGGRRLAAPARPLSPRPVALPLRAEARANEPTALDS